MRKKTSLIIGRLFLFCCLFLFVYGFILLWQNLKNSLWDGEHNFNFVIQQERIYLYAYQPFSQVVNIISLPNQMVIPTAKGYGDYQLGKIATLGATEDIGAGALLGMSLSQVFKAPIEGQIICDSSAEMEKDLREGRLWRLTVNWLGGKCETNLSWWDLLRLARSIGRLKLNQVRLIAIEETALWQQQILADQTKIDTVAESLINDFTQRYFTDEKIAAEDLKIVILNATEFNGLARITVELLKNIGAQVISSQDKTEKTNQSAIYFCHPENKASYTLTKISQIFKIEKSQLDERIEADLLLILGEDFLDRFYLK